MNDDIIMLKTSDIKSHPDNPRKDLGDLDELTESIRKHGIMQNLTVTPSLIEGKYIALIGHRRLAAAEKAGIRSVPCKIVTDLEKKEQVAIMLEENMQRNDLSITEQAFGFQMMLDLGESEESIAEKTGFSKSTVHSRLQIAKLKPELVQEATEQYQITIADLAELQKIKSVERRNEVLDGCTDKWSLIRRVSDAVRKQNEEAALELLKPIFKEKGITKGSGETAYRSWNNACKMIATFKTTKMPTKIKISVPKNKKAYWQIDQWVGDIKVYYFTEEGERAKENTTNAQKEAQERQEAKAKIDERTEILMAQEGEFIRRMIDGTFKIKKAEELDAWKGIWPFIRDAIDSYYTPNTTLFFEDGEEQEVSEIHEAIIMSYLSTNDNNIMTWSNYYDERHGNMHKLFKEYLERFGFKITGDAADDIEALLDGTSELYAKEDE